jgi:hypothetical protein
MSTDLRDTLELPEVDQIGFVVQHKPTSGVKAASLYTLCVVSK